MKKHIPIYRSKPHMPLKGKAFEDFTLGVKKSPTKTKK